MTLSSLMDPTDAQDPAKKKLTPQATTPTPQPAPGSNGIGMLASASGGNAGGLQSAITPSPNTPTTSQPAPAPMAPPPIAPVQQQPLPSMAPAKRAYTDATPAMAQEKLNDTYDKGWLDTPNGGGMKYNPSTHYIDPRTGAAELLVNGQIPSAPAQQSGPMVTGPGGNLIPASSQNADKYQGPPIDRFGQLITPNTQSDGAGGFRSDVPLGGDGLPIPGLPTWESTASGAPAAIAPVGGTSGAPSGGPSAGYANSSGSLAPTGGSSVPGASVNQIDPSNDLRSKSVTPDAGVDRFKLVSDQLNNYKDQMLPQLRAETRAATQSAAAGGRTGSGMFRTDLGNLDLAAERDLNSKFSDLLSHATEGTIGDSRSNRDELRTERGYQTGQEQNAFDRSRQGVFDEDYLKGTDFNRSFQRLAAGEQGNPSGTLAQIGGQQANGAQDTISSLMNGVQTNHAAAGGSTAGTFASMLADYLKKHGSIPTGESVVGDG